MIKKICLAFFILCFLVDSNIVAMARDGYRRGCIKKVKCHYRGIVDANDPYCPDCEFIKYPQRFVACLFCRKPLRKGLGGSASSSCFACFRNIESLLVDQLFVKANDTVDMPEFYDAQHKQALKGGIKAFLAWAQTGVNRSFIKDFYFDHLHTKIFKVAKPSLAKPLVYVGAKREKNGTLVHLWQQGLQIEPEDKKRVLDSEEATKHISNIFLKYNICGPETGEIIEQDANSEMITYQELPKGK